MKILIFEWMTGGGRFADGTVPNHDCPFQKQGRAMACAISEDFLACGHHPILALDARLERNQFPHLTPLRNEFLIVESAKNLWSQLHTVARQVDHILVIAPETEDCLASVLDHFRDHRDKLIQPDKKFARLATSKHQLAIFASDRGIPTPLGFRWNEQPEHNLRRLEELKAKTATNPTLRIKPNDGAGGEGQTKLTLSRLLTETKIASQQLLNPSLNSDNLKLAPEQIPCPGDRIEIEVEGTSVSVSAISTNSGTLILPPTQQVFDEEGTYLRSAEIIPQDLARKATILAEQVISVLPPTRGYFGMDLVIGANDTLIEVNPRLTTSYIMLREIVDFNLAEAML